MGERELGAEYSYEEFYQEQNKLDAQAMGKREDVVNNPEYFDASTGKTNYPEGSGVKKGSEFEKTLEPGERITREGNLDGTYVAPEGTRHSEIATPEEEGKTPQTTWEIVKPIEVEGGEIAPGFGEKGGGEQYGF